MEKIKDEDLKFVSGADKLLQMLDQRELTDIAPMVMPHGISWGSGCSNNRAGCTGACIGSPECSGECGVSYC